jgi:hypothetical protein
MRRSMLLHVTKARLVRPFSLDLWFSDGLRKRVNLRRVLTGPIFLPLRDPKWFARVKLDRIGGSVVWPNGANFAPEYLHGLPDERARARTGRKPRRKPAARAAARR